MTSTWKRPLLCDLCNLLCGLCVKCIPYNFFKPVTNLFVLLNLNHPLLFKCPKVLLGKPLILEIFFLYASGNTRHKLSYEALLHPRLGRLRALKFFA